MSNIGYIYYLLFPNGKYYIGQAKNWRRRWMQHKKCIQNSKK